MVAERGSDPQQTFSINITDTFGCCERQLNPCGDNRNKRLQFIFAQCSVIVSVGIYGQGFNKT